MIVYAELNEIVDELSELLGALPLPTLPTLYTRWGRARMFRRDEREWHRSSHSRRWSVTVTSTGAVVHVAKILRMTQGKVEMRCVIHYDSDVQRTVAGGTSRRRHGRNAVI